jgi:hypothetical protein
MVRRGRAGLREIAEQILPDLGIPPDTQLKADPQTSGLIAQTAAPAMNQAQQEQPVQTSGATLPEVR